MIAIRIIISFQFFKTMYSSFQPYYIFVGILDEQVEKRTTNVIVRKSWRTPEKIHRSLRLDDLEWVKEFALAAAGIAHWDKYEKRSVKILYLGIEIT